MLDNHYAHYHAHIYYDASSVMTAQEICIALWKRFHIQLGRMHQKCVGPHPAWSCQISFCADEFESLTDYLQQHSQGLSVLIHPTTGDDLRDHSTLAQWIGRPLVLKLDLFS